MHAKHEQGMQMNRGQFPFSELLALVYACCELIVIMQGIELSSYG